MIIDAENLILGRLASFAAKSALAGEEIVIINAEKTVITGRREQIFERYKFKRDVGDPIKGPFNPRMPDRIVRRTIRGMLPRKTLRGRDAFSKIQVFIGKPDDIDGEIKKLDNISISKLKDMKYIKLSDVSSWLGARW